mgnify:CR=1 FL=1
MRIYVTSPMIADKFPGEDLGLMMNKSYLRCDRYPIALDNGAYGAWASGEPWDEIRWLKMVVRCEGRSEIEWVVVPDVVADRDATLCSWSRWAWILKRAYGYNLAFVVQDGMTPADVPLGKAITKPTGGHDAVPVAADIVFVGGTTEWKWKTLRMWTAHFPRVHVGKVNSLRQLLAAHDAGAESVDGSGFAFESKRRALTHYLNRSKIPAFL